MKVRMSARSEDTLPLIYVIDSILNHISAKCWWIYKSSYKSCRNICKVSILKYGVILSVTQWLWWPVFNINCVLIYLRRWVVPFKICIIKWKLAFLQAVWIYFYYVIPFWVITQPNIDGFGFNMGHFKALS